MAQLTAGKVRVYKAVGPAKEEKRIVLGPVEASALDTLDRYDGSGSMYTFKQGFDLQQDQWLVVTYNHTTACVAASTKILVTGKMNYKSVDGSIVTADWNLTEATTNITTSASTVSVESDIVTYQIPRDISVAIRAGDQFYLYLADA